MTVKEISLLDMMIKILTDDYLKIDILYYHTLADIKIKNRQIAAEIFVVECDVYKIYQKLAQIKKAVENSNLKLYLYLDKNYIGTPTEEFNFAVLFSNGSGFGYIAKTLEMKYVATQEIRIERNVIKQTKDFCLAAKSFGLDAKLTADLLENVWEG